MFPKSKPYRSKAFLKFCHENMKPAPCCVCGDRPWDQLHHFGDDGGQSLKPSDNEVARICMHCHMKWDMKRKSLTKQIDYEKLSILESFQNDALKLNRAYIEHLEEIKERSTDSMIRHLLKGNDECAREEAVQRIFGRHGLHGQHGMDEQEWWEAWSIKRCGNILDYFADYLREIANESDGELSRITAQEALKKVGMEGEAHGENKDRMVR